MLLFVHPRYPANQLRHSGAMRTFNQLVSYMSQFCMWQRQSSWSQLMLERTLSQLLSLTCGLWFTSASISQHKQLRVRAVLSTFADLGSRLNSHDCCSHSLQGWTSGSSQSILGYDLTYPRLKTEGSTTLGFQQLEPGCVHPPSSFSSPLQTNPTQ